MSKAFTKSILPKFTFFYKVGHGLGSIIEDPHKIWPRHFVELLKVIKSDKV